MKNKDRQSVPTKKSRVVASLGRAGLVAIVAGLVAAPVLTKGAQSPDPVAKTAQSVQTNAGASPGIVFVDVTPDTITTIKTAQNVITRVALPREAKQAICGDLFDAASNTGSFVIDRSGNDVFIKPVSAKGQTNLFIKTDEEVYNFDLTVVPAAQAYRVVNVNLPSYQQEIADRKAAAEREIDQKRQEMENEMGRQLAARKQELEQQSASDLATEQKRLRADADRRAADMATRRFIDGIMQGFVTVPLRERRGQVGDLEVNVDDAAYVFEGKLYVRFRVTNRGSAEVTYAEPRLVKQDGERDKPLTATIFTSRGDYRVPAGQTVAGIAVFEQPALDKGERLTFVMRVGADRTVQLRLLEQG